MPVELRDQIVDRYRVSGADEAPVAVRSSATAEDLAYASFAGQQDTYLNVVGADALVEAVRGCWASLWTERAVNYRNANGIDHRSVTLAVVVQEMVEATAAGVMFTANPLTGTRHESVIDASPGLGEAVVSGAVNPDHYVVDTKARSIIQRRPGDKRVVIRGRAGGGTERSNGPTRAEPRLSMMVRCWPLAELGRRSTTITGRRRTPNGPWPATVVLVDPGAPDHHPLPDARLAPVGDRLFMCLTLAQGLTRPITPMGLASFRLIGRRSRARRGGRPRTAAPDPSRSASPVNACSWI